MPGQSGYAVGWGTLALINAGLAQGKGRSGAVWFAVSLLIGPIATLLIVLLPAPLAEPGTQPSADRGVLIAVLLVLIVILSIAILSVLTPGGPSPTSAARPVALD